MFFIPLCFGTVLLAAPPPPPIVGGQTDTEHPEVLMIAQGSVCSGTLIHPEWVLTAAHCINTAAEPDFHVVLAGIEPSDTENDFISPAQDIILHPDYGPGLDVGYDAALIHLSEAYLDIPPAILNDIRPADWSTDIMLRLVGYGITASGQGDAGTRRHVDAQYYGYDELWIAADDPGHNYCTGDSGGGTFRPTEYGFVLSGVNAWVGGSDGQEPCSEGIGGATRVDIILDWILDYVPSVSLYSDIVVEPSMEPSMEPSVEPSQEPSHNIDSADPSPTDEPSEKSGCQTLRPHASLWMVFLFLAWLPRSRKCSSL